jgi:hypothetical protein
MYVGLEDSSGPGSYAQVRYGDNGEDPNDLKEPEWHGWNIALADFTDVNLACITKIYVGFGDRDNPVVGGSGIVYFDDIRLYRGRITIYVDANAPPGGDGLDWATAYRYLQDALATAIYGDQIRVAQGIYAPDRSSWDPDGSGSRQATFQLISGVRIYGGYAGFGEPDPNERDINLYETILSGDLDGNDIEVANPHDMWREPSRAENSYHVVTGSGTDTGAVLDGFTIIGGNANGNPEDSGGGMYNSAGNPIVANCTFTGNWASWDGCRGGGGMANYYSYPTITSCTFSDNAASCYGGGGGGGMYNRYSGPMLINCSFTRNSAASYCGGAMWNIWSNPTLTNCTFTENFASYRGGAIQNGYGSFSPTLISCTFSANHSDDEGGAMYNFRSSPALTNCIFKGNSATENGGGIANCFGNSPTLANCIFVDNVAGGAGGGMYNHGYHEAASTVLTNCTFAGNSASNGNAIACDSYEQSYPIDLLITNCILWDEGGGIWNNDGSTITVTFSDMAGGWEGLGNINVDPCFVESGHWADANDPNIVVEPNDPNAVWIDGDYHLKSEGWYWHAQRGVWDWDDVTSRCIDAGNPGMLFGGELLTIPRDPDNDWGENIRINMGAHGGTAEASMPPYDWALLADLTNDGAVNFVDFAHQANDWQESGSEQAGDLDRNGVIEFADLAMLAEDWLEGTKWRPR